MSEVIDYRAKAHADLVAWFNGKVTKPFLDRCREAGLPDDIANDLLNEVLREKFCGLHRFDG